MRNTVGHLVLGMKPVQQAFAENMTEVTIGYPKSPLNGPSLRGAGLKSGQRFAPVAGWVYPGSGDKPRFMLFAERNASVEALLERFGGLVDSDIGPELSKGSVWLMRPEGYVVCSTQDPNELADYLHLISSG